MENWSGLLCLELELLTAGGDVPFACALHLTQLHFGM